jgi:hypothetical protein
MQQLHRVHHGTVGATSTATGTQAHTNRPFILSYGTHCSKLPLPLSLLSLLSLQQQHTISSLPRVFCCVVRPGTRLPQVDLFIPDVAVQMLMQFNQQPCNHLF